MVEVVGLEMYWRGGGRHTEKGEVGCQRVQDGCGRSGGTGEVLQRYRRGGGRDTVEALERYRRGAGEVPERFPERC